MNPQLALYALTKVATARKLGGILPAAIGAGTGYHRGKEHGEPEIGALRGGARAYGGSELGGLGAAALHLGLGGRRRAQKHPGLLLASILAGAAGGGYGGYRLATRKYDKKKHHKK